MCAVTEREDRFGGFCCPASGYLCPVLQGSFPQSVSAVHFVMAGASHLFEMINLMGATARSEIFDVNSASGLLIMTKKETIHSI